MWWWWSLSIRIQPLKLSLAVNNGPRWSRNGDHLANTRRRANCDHLIMMMRYRWWWRWRVVMEESDILREVELGFVAAESEGGLIVGSGSVLGCVEGAQPNTGSLVRVPDLGCPFAPWPLPHTSIPSCWWCLLLLILLMSWNGTVWLMVCVNSTCFSWCYDCCSWTTTFCILCNTWISFCSTNHIHEL